MIPLLRLVTATILILSAFISGDVTDETESTLTQPSTSAVSSAQQIDEPLKAEQPSVESDEADSFVRFLRSTF